MEKKFGVYICKGCGIGESINVEKLEKASKPAADHGREYQRPRHTLQSGRS